MIITFDEIFYRNACFLNHEIIYVKTKKDALKYYFSCNGIVVRLGVTLDEIFLRKFSQLQFVATITTGLDHIDFKYCCQSAIPVFSLKGETTFLSKIRATPEHVWGLILALMRKTIPAVTDVKKERWDRDRFVGSELYEKSMGIIGYGRVGKIIERYAIAFGMKVLIYDVKNKKCRKQTIQYKRMNDLLKRSDIISVHVPLGENTTYLIGADEFNVMEKKPWFINTSRGRVVDEKALYDALENKQIKGAALDVLEDEINFKPYRARNSLIQYCKNNSNLIITPHICGTTNESMEKTAIFIEQKIKDFMNSDK